ncbi:MAG: hypothetical protein L0H70_05470 [Xanthomonadales bacterium]|nr:hypothetical protein [Xanthomonadales bacterium]
MLNFPKTYLGVYSLVLTAAFAGLVLMGAKANHDASFDTINVHRINVREPDGTLRMVISNRTDFPGQILHGKEYPHERPRAGMIFYNDEGTEQGGLIFSGHKTADGYSSGLSLTFDRYDQDQQLQLIGLDKNGHYFAGMQVNDVPHRPILNDIQEAAKLKAMPKDKRMALMQKRQQENYYGAPRYFAGKSMSGNSVVMLKDANGKPRLALMVTPEGKASIEFLDANGKVQRTLSAGDVAKSSKPQAR